jgi:hypothetical protein
MKRRDEASLPSAEITPRLPVVPSKLQTTTGGGFAYLYPDINDEFGTHEPYIVKKAQPKRGQPVTGQPSSVVFILIIVLIRRPMRLGALVVPEPAIHAIRCEQFGVRTAFDGPAARDHNDLVHVNH